MSTKTEKKIVKKEARAAAKKAVGLTKGAKQKNKNKNELRAVRRLFIDRAGGGQRPNFGPKLRAMRKGLGGLTDVGRYMACLLDCDTYGPCHYPDAFDGKVALANLKFETQITQNATTGEFGYVINPTIKNHFGYTYAAGATTKVYEVQNTYQQPSVGGSYADVNAKCFDINSTSFVPANYSGDWVRQDASSTLTGRLTNSYPYVVLPAYSSATLTVVNVTTVTGLAPSFQIVYEDGSTATAVSGATALTASMTGFNIQCKANASAPKDYILTLDVKISIVSTGSSVNDLMAWSDMPSLTYLDAAGGSTGTPLCIKYRTVALNAWLEYEGSSLYDGGEIAAISTQPGVDPTEIGWLKYSTLTLNKNAQRNKLKLGKYSWWRPDDQNYDMQFRASQFSNLAGDPSKGPYPMPAIVHAGVAVISPNAPTLTLKTVMTIEYTTEVDFINTTRSHVNTQEINATFAAISGFPQHMENPLHLKQIADKIASVIESGAGIVQRYAPYIPAAVAGASAMFPAGAPAFAALGAGAVGASKVLGSGAKAYRKFRGAEFGKQ